MSQTYNIEELAALVDLPPRTVRYYVQQGLLEPPVGAGRGAHYTLRHAEQLAQIRKWQQAGLALERIRELLHGAPPPVAARPVGPGTLAVWSRLTIDYGVELHLEPQQAGLSPEQVKQLLVAVQHAYAAIKAQSEENA